MSVYTGHGSELVYANTNLAVGTTTIHTFTSSQDPPEGIEVGDLLCIAYRSRRIVAGAGTSTSVLPAGWDVALASMAEVAGEAWATRLLWRVADGGSDDHPIIGVARTGPSGDTVQVHTAAHMFGYRFADVDPYDSGAFLLSGPMDTPTTGTVVLAVNVAGTRSATVAPTIATPSGHGIRRTSTTIPPATVSDSIFSFVGPPTATVASPTWTDIDAGVSDTAVAWATFAVQLPAGGWSLDRLKFGPRGRGFA